jgi:uncharacterized protein (TIGR02466 family)
MSSTRSYEVIDLNVLNSGLTAAHSFMWADAAEHKAGLIEAVEAQRRTSSGINRTNIGGGWHSDIDLPQWPHPSIQALMRWIIDCADGVVAATNDVGPGWRRAPWIAHAWANVNPPGGAANALHEHVQMNWHWSGCYYVQCDDIDARGANGDAELGRLVFENRWHGLRLKAAEPRAVNRYFHVPRQGEVVFFPAWQHHRVEPHRQQGNRISIAFNLYSPELERSRYWTFRPGPLPRRLPAVHNIINRLRGGKAHHADGTPPGYPVG